jgi:hypothetical protein
MTDAPRDAKPHRHPEEAVKKSPLAPPVWSAVTRVTALTASVRAAIRGWCNLAWWHERRLDLLALQDEQEQ